MINESLQCCDKEFLSLCEVHMCSSEVCYHTKTGDKKQPDRSQLSSQTCNADVIPLLLLSGFLSVLAQSQHTDALRLLPELSAAEPDA